MGTLDKLPKINDGSLPGTGPRGRAETKQERSALSLFSPGKAERGVVLVVVLVLSAVALALITALVYMITVGTQTSGMQKRYRNALEAGIAGKDLMFQIIDQRGVNSATVNNEITALLNNWTAGGLHSTSNIQSLCSGTAYASGSGVQYTGASAKNMTSAAGNWSSSCGSTTLTVGMDPSNPLAPPVYDYKFLMGTNPQYTVYAKIVDVREGNTGGGSGGTTGGTHILVNSAVVQSGGGGGQITSATLPYLYEIEIDAENNAKTNEKAKLSILYQY